ncbi:MAG: alpha/beta hydrolase [Sedimentitalea sp.]
MRLAVVAALVTLTCGCSVVDNAVDRTEMEVEGVRLYISGLITSRTPANFENLLDENPQLRVVVPLDMAGTVDEAATYRMGDVIRASGLDTHLVAGSEIYSGGVSLFLAGNRRTMEQGAIVGVHSWADGFGEGSDYPRDAYEHVMNVEYTQDMLGSDAFYWFTLQAAPSDGIHIMTRAEMQRFGMLKQ